VEQARGRAKSLRGGQWDRMHFLNRFFQAKMREESDGDKRSPFSLEGKGKGRRMESEAVELSSS